MECEKYIYFLGFLKQDGHISFSTRNRGQLVIEISARDSDILYKMKDLDKGYLKERIRDTNFKSNYKSKSLSFYQKDFRDKVTKDIKSEKYENNTIFMRGEFDADGSCGFLSGNGNPPFMSLVLTNDKDCYKWKNFIECNTDRIVNVNPNNRDNVRNVIVKNEDAQKILSLLYKDSNIHLDRKFEIYSKIINWQRPDSLKKAPLRKRWNKEEDDYILKNTITQSMKTLNRTEKSIKTRLSRIKTS